MMYSTEPRNRLYVKRYGFLSFAKSIGTHATKVAKNVSNNYGQKLLDSAKISTTDAIKTTSKRAIQKTAEATGDLVGNSIADKITSVSSELRSTKNDGANSETEIPKKDTYLQKICTIEYHKKENLLDNTLDQPSKFRTKN